VGKAEKKEKCTWKLSKGKPVEKTKEMFRGMWEVGLVRPSSPPITIQGQLPAKIIFTTTLTDLADVSCTVPAGVNSVTIEASVQVPWVLLVLLQAHPVSTKEEVEAAVVR